MNDPFFIAADRLPPGFAERLGHAPEHPAEPRPAATAVLLRDAAGGLEVLLLRRPQSVGFVPGAYVFPGGRVDDADADARLIALSDAAPPEPEVKYRHAAVREVFEETGVLLAYDAQGRPAPDAHDARLARWREALRREEAVLADVLEAEARRLRPHALVYGAHWVTPVAEPRRYDTRFFLAGLPPGRSVLADPREVTDALWLGPADALRRFRAGVLPMVFPTLKMLESLDGLGGTDEALARFRGRPVPTMQPRLVRTPEGVRMVLD
ncbi:MAG: NUDIX domain-containing protein [Candidatus Rokubacteria bacterium]|nr:NUDIX domain-containing protein [Candidatus Rokubacteria bacterium]